MDFDGNYRQLGVVDISSLIRCVMNVPEMQWVAGRPPIKQTPAYECQTFKVYGEAGFSHAFPAVILSPALTPVLEVLDRLDNFHGKNVRCLLARLQPGCIIREHVDEFHQSTTRVGFTYSPERRIHLPILTNDSVTFTVGGEDKQMKAGEIWEINNQRPHSVCNTGKTSRVHLIIDRSV